MCEGMFMKFVALRMWAVGGSVCSKNVPISGGPLGSEADAGQIQKSNPLSKIDRFSASGV